MKIKSILFLMIFFSLIATNALTYATTDPELEALQQQELLSSASKKLEINKRQMEDFNITSEVYGRCGQPPAITPENVYSKTKLLMNSIFGKWDNCARMIIMAENSNRVFQKRLTDAVEAIDKLGIRSKAEQECGAIPPLPKDKSSNEQQKFEIKSRLWSDCSKKLVDSAKAENEKREQSEARERELEREKEAEREKRVLEDAQKAINEANKILETKQKEVKPAVMPKVQEKSEDIGFTIRNTIATTTSAEKPAEPIETKHQVSKVKQIFKKLFGFFTSSK